LLPVWLARRETSTRSISTVGFAFGGLQVVKTCTGHPGLIQDALMRFNPLNRSVSDMTMVPRCDRPNLQANSRFYAGIKCSKSALYLEAYLGLIWQKSQCEFRQLVANSRFF
jgi:hypothetical protein